jgi:hypothetical protein
MSKFNEIISRAPSSLLMWQTPYQFENHHSHPLFQFTRCALTHPVRNRTTEARTQRLLNYASGRVKTESETNLDEINLSQGNKTNCRTQKNTELPFS